MRREHKWICAVLLAAFLVIGVSAALGSAGKRSGSETAPEPVYLSYGKIETVEFLEESYAVSVGSQLGLRLRTQPEVYDDVLTWKSSDATVLRVDNSGIVTACANGTAVITVSCGASSDSVTISVVDDILVEAEECIRRLVGGCNAQSLADAELMLEKLDRCSIDGADDVSALIKNIIAYISGGDRDALEAAIAATGKDKTLCRTAAVCCWSYGEQLECDGVISFAGDCTLARFNESDGKGRFPSVYAASGSLTYPFDRVKGVFSCDDFTLINFEGTLTDSTSHYDKNFFFRGNPEYARMLPAASIEGANIANNHSHDYYQTGYNDTMRHLTEAGVSVVSSNEPLITQVGRVNVVLIAQTSGGEEYTDRMHRSLLEQIGKYKDPDTVVIVNLHWGVEGSDTPAQWQRTAAHELIDAGADMIVGHHPHVLQGLETYNGKYIAYSIGNFAFGGNGSANSPQTCILRARLGIVDGMAAVTGISVLPCRITSTGNTANNYQPMLCFGSDGDSVFSTLMARSRAAGGVSNVERPDV